MRHKNGLIVAIVIVLIIIVGAYAVMHVNISALPEPGPFETSIATKAKDWYISRAARGSLPPAPTNDASSVSAGETIRHGVRYVPRAGRPQADTHWQVDVPTCPRSWLS
jgi:hypothetical protein